MTQPDSFDSIGNLSQSGQFHLHSDGHNQILIVHPSGLDQLAQTLHEDPAHLERLQRVAAIKAGEHDEANWLPAGFSRRPKIDVSRDEIKPPPPLALQFNLPPHASVPQIAQIMRDNLAQRFEHGQDPTLMVSELRSELLRQTQVDPALHDAWRQALDVVVPAMKAPVGLDGQARRVTTQDQVDHKRLTDERLRGYHAGWLQNEVKAGRLASEAVSVHRQTLPQTDATRDLLHQVSIQDPRLRHAFGGVGDLGHAGRRAVRDYAYEHVFGLDPKNGEEPISPLSPDERRAWEQWRDLARSAPEGDPYRAIQAQWKQSDEESGGGLFGDAPEPHAFASVDLSDDRAVIEAARAHAQTLGYTPERRVTDARSGQYQDVVPELETNDDRPGDDRSGDGRPGNDRPENVVAREARSRIQAQLRARAYTTMFGTPGVGGDFNAGNVATASGRWAQYVGDMGGEKRAYAAICDTMKGDFATRFAKGFRQQTGRDWKTVHTPVAHAEKHFLASLPPEKRREVEAQARSEQAKAMNRAGGKFAEGGVKDRLDDQRAERDRGAALFGQEATQTQGQQLATQRVTLGTAAEAMVKGLIPNVHLTKGTAAAGDIDMSTGDNIKRQRAIKQLEAVGRMMFTLGTGSGKTSIGLACHSHLKAQNKLKRSIFAVPSQVQENFGAEAARFYDVTSPEAPKWFAQGGVDAKTRRAAYHHESGHDICVVTHQALRDDLNWALAQQRFGGDEKAARKYLQDAPTQERTAAIKAATEAQGWHFDMAVTDEAHGLLNRQGKENSAMANALDGFMEDKPYFASMSADPVKNDASESFSALAKVAPSRYVEDDHPDAHSRGVVTKSEFLRRYAVNTPAASEALQAEMAPYQYAESIDPDTQKRTQTHQLDLTPPQKRDYDTALAMYQRARAARRGERVDIEAVQALSPGSFEGVPQSEHEAVAKRLQSSLGMLRRAALNRVVNFHPQGTKLRQLDAILQEHPAGEHPKVIFAHNRAAVDLIHDHLKSQGVRVVKIDGSMGAQEKQERQLGFSPQWDASANRYVNDPRFDVCVYSDAGAAGWNAPRANQIIHYDTPDTAMTFRQREGRAYRVGQTRDVTVHHLLTDTQLERTARARLERKDDMRDALTTPAELIDDTGLSAKIRQEVTNAREKLVKSAVSGGTPAGMSAGT